jgi:transposase-like protein
VGPSTRRVEGLVEALGITSLSKSQVSELAKSLDAEVAAFRARPLYAGPYPYVWVDALAVKCREQGRIVNVACVLGRLDRGSPHAPELASIASRHGDR